MDQPELFDDAIARATEVATHIVDTEAIARSGDARNQKYDPNARGSEPHEALGGAVTAARLGELAARPAQPQAGRPKPRQTVPRSKLSSRGKAAADREPDTTHDPAYAEHVPLTTEEKDYGNLGLKYAGLLAKSTQAEPVELPEGRLMSVQDQKAGLEHIARIRELMPTPKRKR